MALIKCGGCESVHESTLVVCPVCGRCPRCGTKRAPDLKKFGDCRECQAPYCSGCGRCHRCGSVRPTDLPPCSCGHPTDKEGLAQTEKAFAIAPHTGFGCATAIVIGAAAFGFWIGRAF